MNNLIKPDIVLLNHQNLDQYFLTFVLHKITNYLLYE